MFNTNLSDWNWMSKLLFFWVLIFATTGLTIWMYRWVKPTEYKVINKVDVSQLKYGDHVKFQEMDLCVSDVRTYSSTWRDNYVSLDITLVGCR